jgi:hypothetical protein
MSKQSNYFMMQYNFYALTARALWTWLQQLTADKQAKWKVVLPALFYKSKQEEAQCIILRKETARVVQNCLTQCI